MRMPSRVSSSSTTSMVRLCSAMSSASPPVPRQRVGPPSPAETVHYRITWPASRRRYPNAVLSVVVCRLHAPAGKLHSGQSRRTREKGFEGDLDARSNRSAQILTSWEMASKVVAVPSLPQCRLGCSARARATALACRVCSTSETGEYRTAIPTPLPAQPPAASPPVLLGKPHQGFCRKWNYAAYPHAVDR